VTPIIEVRDVERVYETLDGERIHALAGVTLSIDEGEFVTVVGPSGCGKTTLLRLLAGLDVASGGEVLLGGARVTGPSRQVGMVFQAPVLLPWRTVLQNVLLPVEVFRLPHAEFRARAVRLLDVVGLGGFAEKYPFELSGGMQQRVAIVRALLFDPKVLLMDEPFGALDAMTREQMNLDLQRIWMAQRKTVAFITHSVPEAVFLADRVVVMSARPGRIAKIVDVPLPRPRSMDVLGGEAFGRLTTAVRQMLGHGGGVD
jgi:NitT/TauT family transport system ATP-binding protein